MPSHRGVFIIHKVRGRVRIGVDALRRDPSRAEAIAAQARECPSVIDARGSAWAACLAVEHEPDVPLEEVFNELSTIPELSGCVCLPTDELAPPRCAANGAPPGPSRTAGLVVEAAVKLNSATSALAPPQVDLKLLVPGVLVGYGLIQALTRGASAAPHWITLVKYGFDTFAVLNQDRITRYLEGLAGSAGGKTG